MSKYAKKPVTIEAIRWDGMNSQEIKAFVGEAAKFETKVSDNGSGCSASHTELVIHTLEGNMHADFGDYIIKGVKGEFYPCKPDIFMETYTKAAETFKDRLIDEFNELVERKEKLAAFIKDNPIYKTIDRVEQRAMKNQLHVMEIYVDILFDRLDRINFPLPTDEYPLERKA